MIINRITSLYWESERHLGLLFMLFTGVRVGELATLKTFDFLPGNKLHIQRTISKEKDENGKSHRVISDFPKTPTSDSFVYLSDDAVAVYNQVMKLRKQKGITSEFVFSEKGTYIATTKGHYYFSTKKDDAIREALNRNNKLCVNI